MTTYYYYPEDETEVKPKPRGFAAMTPERRREVASRGGSAVPADRRHFSRDKECASYAGMKGGSSVPAEKRSYAVDRELAAKSGAKSRRKKSRRSDSHHTQDQDAPSTV